MPVPRRSSPASGARQRDPSARSSHLPPPACRPWPVRGAPFPRKYQCPAPSGPKGQCRASQCPCRRQSPAPHLWDTDSGESSPPSCGKPPHNRGRPVRRNPPHGGPRTLWPRASLAALVNDAHAWRVGQVDQRAVGLHAELQHIADLDLPLRVLHIQNGVVR